MWLRRVLRPAIGLLSLLFTPFLLVGQIGPAPSDTLVCGSGQPMVASTSFYQEWGSLFTQTAILAATESTSPDNRYIVIDLKTRTLTLYVNGSAVKRYSVAIGTEEDPSPVGEWRVIHKAHWGGGFGTRWMGLNVPWGTYGIHGTNKPWSIGRSASHGCFRMLNRTVEELYPLVPIGTPVVVQGPDVVYSPFDLIGPGDAYKMNVVLQKRLRDFGLPIAFADGRYGPDTTAAVKNLEAFMGLPVDGVAKPDEQWVVRFR